MNSIDGCVQRISEFAIIIVPRGFQSDVDHVADQITNTINCDIKQSRMISYPEWSENPSFQIIADSSRKSAVSLYDAAYKSKSANANVFLISNEKEVSHATQPLERQYLSDESKKNPYQAAA